MSATLPLLERLTCELADVTFLFPRIVPRVRALELYNDDDLPEVWLFDHDTVSCLAPITTIEFLKADWADPEHVFGSFLGTPFGASLRTLAVWLVTHSAWPKELTDLSSFASLEGLQIHVTYQEESTCTFTAAFFRAVATLPALRILACTSDTFDSVVTDAHMLALLEPSPAFAAQLEYLALSVGFTSLQPIDLLTRRCPALLGLQLSLNCSRVACSIWQAFQAAPVSFRHQMRYFYMTGVTDDKVGVTFPNVLSRKRTVVLPKAHLADLFAIGRVKTLDDCRAISSIKVECKILNV